MMRDARLEWAIGPVAELERCWLPRAEIAEAAKCRRRQVLIAAAANTPASLTASMSA